MEFIACSSSPYKFCTIIYTPKTGLSLLFHSTAQSSEVLNYRASGQHERWQVRVFAPTTSGVLQQWTAGDGAAAVRRSAAETGAGLSRRMPCCSVLLLPHRRVLLRPIGHICDLITAFARPSSEIYTIHVRVFGFCW
ncbi:uncharacterized protein LOC133889854 [Phragmites australis]|uniref:uncharacterized protein LOC133889854 n=1 Tax=Phragmites australis TaxID=29695 RepID=UPI002D79F30A|nr:uncharacterized protein LOC133889854 [Phragmites australis]